MLLSLSLKKVGIQTRVMDRWMLRCTFTKILSLLTL